LITEWLQQLTCLKSGDDWRSLECALHRAAGSNCDQLISLYDFLLAALGERTAMTVRWYARQQNWPLDQVEVTLTHAKGGVEGKSVKSDHFTKTIRVSGKGLTEFPDGASQASEVGHMRGRANGSIGRDFRKFFNSRPRYGLLTE
jgi:hypothetical protein